MASPIMPDENTASTTGPEAFISMREPTVPVLQSIPWGSSFVNPFASNHAFGARLPTAPVHNIDPLLVDTSVTEEHSMSFDNGLVPFVPEVGPISTADQQFGFLGNLYYASPHASSSPTPPEGLVKSASSQLRDGAFHGSGRGEARSYSPQNMNNSCLNTPYFQCKWRDCQSTTFFRREHDLIRHLRSIHIRPAAYVCDIDGCRRTFGRKDHLLQHRRRRHPMFFPK